MRDRRGAPIRGRPRPTDRLGEGSRGRWYAGPARARNTARGVRGFKGQWREPSPIGPLVARQWERTRLPPANARDTTTMSLLTLRLTTRTRAVRTARALIGALLLVALLASAVLGASPRRLATQVTDCLLYTSPSPRDR